jgi:hypothetical protein
MPADKCKRFDSVLTLQNFSQQRHAGFRTDVGCPDVDYHMSYDKSTGVVWMTPGMKMQLHRHDHILFVDCQKRQYNKIN